jgi:hypothetical protein
MRGLSSRRFHDHVHILTHTLRPSFSRNKMFACFLKNWVCGINPYGKNGVYSLKVLENQCYTYFDQPQSIGIWAHNKAFNVSSFCILGLFCVKNAPNSQLPVSIAGPKHLQSWQVKHECSQCFKYFQSVYTISPYGLIRRTRFFRKHLIILFRENEGRKVWVKMCKSSLNRRKFMPTFYLELSGSGMAEKHISHYFWWHTVGDWLP